MTVRGLKQKVGKDDMLSLTFLGSGGAFTDFRQNYHTNVVVHTDLGPVLIDCGGTAVQSLKELEIPVWNLAGVIITHMHGDHIGGLEQLLWERYYTGPDGPGYKSTPVLATRPVQDALRRSLMDCVDEITTPDGTVSGGYDVLVHPIAMRDGGNAMVCGEVRFILHKTKHVEGPGVSKPCYGVEISEHGGTAMAYYTSDTIFDPEIYKRFNATIFHDCSFGPKYPGTVHTHYEELCSLSPSEKARTVLMHHTTVPDGIDPVSEGFRGVADRHSIWTV